MEALTSALLTLCRELLPLSASLCLHLSRFTSTLLLAAQEKAHRALVTARTCTISPSPKTERFPLKDGGKRQPFKVGSGTHTITIREWIFGSL
ncbi:hypothetical protein PAMP_018352 [Pampus punctatissimus]